MVEPKITYKNGVITIVAELDTEGEDSSSGKTLVLASTHGFTKVKTDDGEVSVSLNICKKKQS